MSYSTIKKTRPQVSEVPKKRFKWIYCLIVLLVIVVAMQMVSRIREQEDHQKVDAEIEQFEVDVAKRQLSSAGRMALISLHSYYQKWEVSDPEFDLNAIQHKLKIDVEKVQSGYEKIDKLKTDMSRILEEDKYDIIRHRREANEVFRAHGNVKQMVDEETEFMGKMYGFLVKKFNRAFSRCFDEPLTDEEE